MHWLKRTTLGLVAAALLLTLSTLTASANAYTITVTGTSDGVTEKWIGATEGGTFSVTDLVDLGFNSYRIWGSSAEYEPVDDDGVYGSPTIAEIKADPGIIPWTTWDTQFKDPLWRTISLYDMLVALRDNDIRPVVSLVNVNNKDEPAWMQQLNPPTTEADWNEWWEHVFAWVYYANYLNDLEVHDWQVLNEPDNSSQGWDGTVEDYILFTQYTHDAIQYVYDTYLPGETFRLYAPVSTHPNEWITESLIQNDAIVDVVDWHRYGPPPDEAAMIHGWIDQYDSDGVHEELYLSEWGTYRSSYDSHSAAMNYSEWLISHSYAESYVAGSAIFSMYDWGPDDDNGIVRWDGTRTPTFWAFRLVTRGLQGGKTRYPVTHAIPSNQRMSAIAAVDEATQTMYVTIENRGVKDHTLTLDLSAHAATGTATLHQYADGVHDEVVGTADLVNGILVVDSPASTILQVILPLGGGPTPTPTPTPEPGGAMHVGEIAMSTQKTGVNYKAQAVVTVVDGNGAPVADATVYGTFSGATGDSVSDLTDADGQVTLLSSNSKQGGSWTFCVDDIAKAGWTYDEDANVETCDSVTAP